MVHRPPHAQTRCGPATSPAAPPYRGLVGVLDAGVHDAGKCYDIGGVVDEAECWHSQEVYPISPAPEVYSGHGRGRLLAVIVSVRHNALVAKGIGRDDFVALSHSRGEEA